MFFLFTASLLVLRLLHQLRRGVLVCGRDGVCTWIHSLHVVNSTNAGLIRKTEGV